MQGLLDALNELTRANEARDDAAFAAASARFLDKMTDFVGDSRPAATSIDDRLTIERRGDDFDIRLGA